ncbi:MAG: carboxypeptidase regulatory-like domain-containing protein [Candidatus Marinimicrobia bacterium]|nr:carboxypeptidase regulatory-like domain-containing protein [Candidatus Neomarinimicrobiota bacterium]
MAKKSILNKVFIGVLITLFSSVLFAQKPRTVSGTLINSDGDGLKGITVLLLSEDGTEANRDETSKKGDFKLKKVPPGNYTLEADGGEAGKVSSPVEVSKKNVKLGDISLANEVVDTPKVPESIEVPTQDSTPDAIAFQPDAGKDYILNELSFEIKKMTAELKYLNEEIENLKALSKMWVNPLAIYSKEIIMKNGSTVFGKIVYQDEESIKVESLVGYLIINRQDVVRIVDNVVTEEQAEYVPEQVRDSYTPPPMPKLAEPQYTSSERETSNKYSANCVLMGNISEKKDAQGNIVFNGEIKNIGGRRSDFVKVDFVFRKNWSGETKTLTTFVRGGYHTFDSGITTDATLLPGATGAFELYVPHDFGSFIGYSYVVDWEEYE